MAPGHRSGRRPAGWRPPAARVPPRGSRPAGATGASRHRRLLRSHLLTGTETKAAVRVLDGIDLNFMVHWPILDNHQEPGRGVARRAARYPRGQVCTSRQRLQRPRPAGVGGRQLRGRERGAGTARVTNVVAAGGHCEVAEAIRGWRPSRDSGRAASRHAVGVGWLSMGDVNGEGILGADGDENPDRSDRQAERRPREADCQNRPTHE